MEDEHESQNIINSLVHNCHPWAGCITIVVFAPRGEDEGENALESEAERNNDCDLFPNSETEPTRVRRMRGEVPQQGDPSDAMMSHRVENAASALTGISAPRKEQAALNGISAPSHGEKKSWANDLTNGAQLVSVRVLRNICQRHVTLNS